MTLRVLYNIDVAPSSSAYIQVGNHINRWCDSRLFIFDDTLMHQSVNDSDDVRYCMFIDILRPSACTWLLSVILRSVRLVALRFNGKFYGRWHVLGQRTSGESDRRSRSELEKRAASIENGFES